TSRRIERPRCLHRAALGAGPQRLAAAFSSGLGEFSTYKHGCAIGLDPLVVQLALGDREYFSWSIDNRVASLLNDERSGNHQPTDLKKMPMPSFARSRSKRL